MVDRGGEVGDEQLLHPVFVDVAMLAGFVAQLAGPQAEGGWAPAGLDSMLEALGQGAWANGTPLPVMAAPVQHYLASGLLGELRRHLLEAGRVRVLRSAPDLVSVEPGDLVEVAGTCVGNPFEDLLGFYGSVIPKILDQEATRAALLEQLRARAKVVPKGRTTGPAAGAVDELIEEMSEGGTDEVAARMILDLVGDIARSPVRDVVVDAGDHAAVLTLATRLAMPDTLVTLRSSHVRALGKVTRVVATDGVIDLAARTGLGMLGGQLTTDLVESARTGPYEVAFADPVVGAPAVQIVPLAITI
ncbi:MAG TPA: hypothetical protein VFP61_09330 [Acidimicrobiales bacterium]|nr:hypothetical protein [Acidimicrobiales bacterium]